MATNFGNIDWANMGLTNPNNTDSNQPRDLGAGLDSTAFNWGAPSAAIPNLAAPPGTNNSSGAWQNKWFGGTDAEGMKSNGIIPTGVGALSGIASAYLGWQQMNLAKNQLEQNKKIFNLNFQNQAQSVNTQLEDRQRARVASNAGAYESVGSYLDKNSVKSKGI